MGYLFLGLALLCGTTKAYCGKRTSGFIRTPSDSITITLIRMSICVFIGLAMVFFDSTATFAIPSEAILLSLLAGITSSIFVISWILSVRIGSLMMIDVFLAVSTIIPIFFSTILFPETDTVSPRQIIGCVILLIAVIIMCSYNKSIKKKTTIGTLLLIALCATANGCTELITNVYSRNEYGAASVFNFYTYVGAAGSLMLVSIGMMIFKGIKKHSVPQNELAEPQEKLQLAKILPYISVMALCLFFNTYFKTLATQSLDAIIVFPISQIGSMMLASIMAHFIFKEKLNLKGIIGIIIALGALLIINWKI